MVMRSGESTSRVNLATHTHSWHYLVAEYYWKGTSSYQSPITIAVQECRGCQEINSVELPGMWHLVKADGGKQILERGNASNCKRAN